MWNYSDKVKNYFFEPKNAGVLEDANAVGEVGSISCGDALRLMLKVDPDSEKILDARFQTFGCGSAIASSSALTEIIKGKTLDEALKITNKDIAEFLDGLPPEKMHCSVMGAEALHAAVANYRGEEWKDDHEEGALICKCFGIDAAFIEKVVRENELRSIEQVTFYTKAGGGCQTCHEGIEQVLLAVNGELPAPAPKKAPATVAVAAPLVMGKAATKPMTNLQKIQKISEALDKLRPQLQLDGGDVELVDVDGDTVSVALHGACMGCQMAGMTVSGIQERLMEAVGRPLRVVPIQQPHTHARA
jgi:NifU-like protein